MEKLLHLKHWQIFLLMVGIPLILGLVGIATVFMHTKLDIFTYIMFGVIFLGMGIFFAWFWILGTRLHAKLPETVFMNLKSFKIFLFITAIYIGFVSIFLVFAFTTNLDLNLPGVIIFVFILLHLFSMFGIYYCLYFISMELKAVELQRPVTFGDFAGEFFLIWFFPLGVWFIQPKVNKIFGGQAEWKQ